MKKGDCFYHSFALGEKEYNGFIDIFHDENPLHTQPEFAKKYGFANQVMHGNMLNGFLSYFIGECLPVKNVIIQTQEIKFIKPVYLNNTIHLCAKIDDVYEAVKSIEFKFLFFNQDKIKVAKGKIQIGLLA